MKPDAIEVGLAFAALSLTVIVQQLTIRKMRRTLNDCSTIAGNMQTILRKMNKSLDKELNHK